MPSFNAHYFFAKQNMDTIKAIFPDVKINEDAVYYGTQGPDLMFFGRLMPTMKGRALRPFGDLLHNACPTMILEAMRDYISTNPENKDIALSFYIGFLCHYALDRNCHPYVYAKEQEIWEEKKKWDRLWIHNVIEHNMDSYTILKLTDFKRAGQMKSYKVLSKDPVVKKTIGQALEYMVPRVCEDGVEAKEGELACGDARLIMWLLQNTTSLKMLLVVPLDRIARPFVGPMFSCFFNPQKPGTRWDYFNEDHKEWRNPAQPEAPRSESFWDLFQYSCEDLGNMLRGFKSAMEDGRDDLTDITGNLSFETGLPVPPTENVKIKKVKQ